jgi:putative transposase
MARMARLVIPDVPHHVTQRGNRRQPIFFRDHDYHHYMALVGRACRRARTAVWAYCLMPNHVHFVMVPSDEDGLRAALGDAHRRYSRAINERFGWRGHLWQERFFSCPMDEAHLGASVRYVERNPIGASLCTTPEQWPWSSARAHLERRDDELVDVRPMLERVENWRCFVGQSLDQSMQKSIAAHTRLGRPLGQREFVRKLEEMTGRTLMPRKRGRKPGR